MKRYLVAGRFGSTDITSVTLRADEVETLLELISQDNKLELGIGTALSELVKKGVFPTEVGVDLLVLAAHVQAADTHISRSSESQDSWTREIRLVVPVSDHEKWNAASLTLKRALDFLTGDIWTLEFRSRPSAHATIVPNGSEQLEGIPFDCISLFSGGLDSLIGAIDLLESGKHPLFISHAGEQAVSTAQDICFNTLKARYLSSNLDRLRVWMGMSKVKIQGEEKTTRGRSFLFFSIGIFAGSGLRSNFTLRVPENGLIALNVPLDPLRLGSHSTRTTHPFYIARWNEVLSILGIPGRVENPYWNKTKGEMVSECSNKDLLSELVPQSLSCSSPTKGRWLGHGTQHCGYCLPCLIRRASLERGLGVGVDTTTYTIADLKSVPLRTSRAEGQQVRSFQFAINRFRSKPNYERLLIHTSGSLIDESPERKIELANVYRRGMEEVDAILQGVRTSP